MFQAGYIHIVENKRHIFGPFNETYSYFPCPTLFWGLHTCAGNNRTTPISTSAHTDTKHLQLSTYMHCYFFPSAFTCDIYIGIYIYAYTLIYIYIYYIHYIYKYIYVLMYYVYIYIVHTQIPRLHQILILILS